MASSRNIFAMIAVLALFLPGRAAIGGEIMAAVASNFASAIKPLTRRFEADTGNTVRLVFGSTGKHYAQIRNGAPYDVFFAADAKRPRLLERAGLAKAGSRFTYAIGKLVLWSPQAGLVDPIGNVLKTGAFRHIAIANPKLAPYGRAAREVLEKRGRWAGLQGRMVRGENIGQTFNFVKSGNSELGFVALSQIKRPGQPVTGSLWLPPEKSYAPIEQQAVLLKDNEVARAFLAFVKSAPAVAIIRGFGYGVSDAR